MDRKGSSECEKKQDVMEIFFHACFLNLTLRDDKQNYIDNLWQSLSMVSTCLYSKKLLRNAEQL